jgi:Flp pilus assembly protein TadB
MWRIPGQLDQVLTRARQGALTVQVSLSPETRRAIRRIDISVKRFAWMVIAAALLLAGVNLHIAGKNPTVAVLATVLAGAAFLWGMRKE